MDRKLFTSLGMLFLFVVIFAGTVCAADPVKNTNVTLNNTASNPTPTVGEQFFFNVTATNNGSNDTEGLQITDVTPSGLTYNGYNATEGTTYDHSTGIWNIGILNKGSSVWLALNVTATAQVAGKTVTNTATRTAEVTNDTAPATAKASVHIPMANVVITNAVDNLTPNVGEEFKYAINAHNYGPDTAVGVEITDILPLGLTSNGYTASLGTYYENNVWHINSLENGGDVWLQLFVTPTADLAGKNVTNTATKTNETTYDPSPKSDNVTVYVPLSHVELSKTASNPKPNVGQNFTYTITAHNYGPDATTNLQIGDYVQNGFIFVNYTASNGTTYNSNTGVWNIGTLKNGADVYLYLVVTPKADSTNKTFINTASKLSEDQYDNATPNSSVSVFVPPQANVEILTYASNPSPNVGEEFIFYVDVYNDGPDMVDFQVKDIIPSGFTYLGFVSNGGNYNSTTGIWYVGTLYVDDSAYLELHVTPNALAAGKTITNIATKTNETIYDPQPLNASANVRVPLSKVVINKTPSKSTPTVGEQFTYTITATNNGPDNASNLQVTDNLPSGLTYNGYTASPGTTYDYSTGVWNIGTLVNSATAWLKLNVTPQLNAASKNVTNTAVRIGQDQYNPESDTAISTVYVPVAQVVLTKTTSNSKPYIGNSFTYKVTATNNGPDSASNLQVTDKIPTGLTFNGYTASPGTTYNSSTGVWNIGTLNSGASVWLNLNVTVTPQLAGQSVNNTANKTSEDQYDNATGAVTAKISVPAEPYVTITITASNTHPNVGGQFTYTVTAKNYSPVTATGVQVTDKIPSGFTITSYTTSTGTNYNNSTGLWNVGTLTSGANAWLKINLKPTAVRAGKDVANAAIKTAETQTDHAPRTAGVTVHVPKVNVQLAMKTSNTAPDIGKLFTYTVTAKNSGPDSASNLKVTDKIPAGLTFSSYTSSPGTSYSSSTGIWTIGTLASGKTVNLYLNVAPVTASTGKTITNTANKTSETEYDTAVKTVSSKVTVPKAAYVVVTNKASNSQPSVGQQFTYTVGAKNNSPITATGVKVTYKVTSGFTLNSYSLSKGTTYDKKTGIWTIGKLTNGQSVALKLNVIPSSTLSGKTVNSTATRTSETTRDPAPKTATATVQVNPTVTVSQILGAAYDVKIYYEHNNALPPQVTIGGKTVVSNAQFLQIMVTAALNLNEGVTSDIAIQKVNDPSADTGSFSAGNIAKSGYLSMAQSIQSFVNNNGRVPNYASSSLGNVPFSKLVYMYSKVLNFYLTNTRLPTNVYIS